MITVESTPSGAHLHRDGVSLGNKRTPHRFETPYYGSVHVEVEPPAREGGPVLLPKSTLVEIGPPLPPYLFPLDLPIEIALWVIGHRNRSVRVVLEERPKAELTPQRAADLIRNTREAAKER